MKKFLTNPITGFVVALIGIILAIYFYFAGLREPKLILLVYPVRTPIVQAGRLSELAVAFHGKPVAGDLTAVQFMFWNSGKAPVRHEDILKPITISTTGDHPIYEATIRKISRDVTGFQLVTNNLASGQLVFDWRILEHNDGASVQVIYGGDQNVRFRSDGIVVGQKFIPYVLADVHKMNFLQTIWNVLGAILLALMFSLIAFNVFAEFKKAKLERKTRAVVIYVFGLIFCVVLAVFFWLGTIAVLWEPFKPPFDF